MVIFWPFVPRGVLGHEPLVLHGQPSLQAIRAETMVERFTARRHVLKLGTRGHRGRVIRNYLAIPEFGLARVII